MRISSGVPGFDALIQGGIPSGAAVVIQGPAGREKDTFLFQFIVAGLRGGGSALVVLSSVSPAKYMEELREAGVDVDRAVAENRLKFVDWFTYKENPVQDVEQDGPVFRASIDLANVGIAISRAIAALSREGERRAAVEVLSPALSAYDAPAVYGFAQSSKAKLERLGITSLFVVEKEMHDERTVSSIHQPFDGVVDIERIREGDKLVRKVAVLSLRGTAADSNYVPIEVGKDRVLRVSGTSVRERTLLRQAALIKSHPKDPKIWLATARNLREMGDHAQALRCADAALKIDANDREAWRVKAEILDALGRTEEAGQARAKAAPPEAPPKKEDAGARLLNFVERRLRNDPRDPDALFVRAAARAKAGDLRGALATLETLAEVDERYPGLWVLKTKLHAKSGDLKKAEESLARRLAIDKQPDRSEQAQAAETTAAPLREPYLLCPSCRTLVQEEDRACPACGVAFEGWQEPPAPLEAQVVEPRPEVYGVSVGPQGTPRGLTNGLAKDLARGTGRTNGLVNGTRDRTNGMTNGLTNGLATLRSGMTNGLTNGSGFTNGLGSMRIRHEAAGRRWKLLIIPVLSGILLIAPLMGPSEDGQYPIAIDGRFSDWNAVPLLASPANATVPPNIDLVRFGITDNVDFLAFYFEVAGTALTGGGSPPILDTFRAFLDVDRDPDTGYAAAGLGGDRLLEVSGADGRVEHAALSEWDAGREPLDWNGWIKPTSISAAVGGPRIEAHVDWLSLAAEKQAIDVAFHAMAYDGAVEAGEYVASTTSGSLHIVENLVVPEIVAGAMVPLVRFELTAAVRDVTYDSLAVVLTGTAPVSAISDVRLVDELGAELGVRIPLTSEVVFQFPPRTLRLGETEELTLFASTTATSGDTLGGRIDGPGDIGAGSAAVSIARPLANRAVGYLGTVPTAAIVDGGFSEWTNTTSDPPGEPGVPARIDLVEYSFYLNAQQASAYFRVSGRALDGAVVPASPGPATGSVPPPADADRDRVPDFEDPFPFDFDNDGVYDVDTGGDYDTDGLLDYPGGPDLYLNTTIPGTFPPAYAGLPVSVYIGPTVRPVVLGEDVARVFLDSDNDTATGLRVDAIGADFLVEIRGKYGEMTSQTLSAFTGASPWDWAWTSLETITVASDFSRVEFAFSALGRNLANDSRAYFELKDWSGRVDSVGQATYRLDTRGGARPQPLDIGGNQRLWLLNTDHASETDCNYNKVASTTQGPGPVQQVSLTTGQSACWYADPTTGTTIPAGSWESLLDVTTSGVGGIAFDIAGTGWGSGTTVNIVGPNVGSGSNRLLLVGIGQGDSAATLTSVTWDQGGTNQAMTRIAGRTQGGGPDTRIELWKLVAPTPGAKTLRIVSPSSVGMAVGIVAYTGVDQTTPNDAPVTAGGSPGSSPSVVVPSAAGELVVDAVSSKVDLSNKNPGPGQTERYEGSGGNEIVFGSEEAGAASVTMSWTGSFEEWAQIGVSLNPANSVEYDVFLAVWDKPSNSVKAAIGSCLNVVTTGADVQCLVSSVGAQVLDANDVVRIRVAHSAAAGTVTIDYDDADLTGDSRITIPTGIPEFEEVALPIIAAVLVPIVWRWSGRRRSKRDRGVAQ